MPHLLIVGAGPGISAATARRFAGEGYAVGLIGRRQAALAESGAELRETGAQAAWASADAADPRALEVACEATPPPTSDRSTSCSTTSPPDGRSPCRTAPDDLLADLAAGAVGLQTAVRAVLPGMREPGAPGTVLVTGGGSAARLIASMATLGVQKAALRALVEVQAQALAPDGIHVVTVTVRGFVGENQQIHPDRVADLYADLAPAETAGPLEQ